jgi:hypothetical protein
MKTLGKGSLALHREVPGYGGGLQAVQDEGRDSKTQGAMKGESTPRGVPSKPTTLSPLSGFRDVIVEGGAAGEWLQIATW